jgi:hypothetical protein
MSTLAMLPGAGAAEDALPVCATIELPTLIERARVNARFIELWAERFGTSRAG